MARTNPPKEFNDITGGLNLTQSTQIPVSDFVIMRNMFYNQAKQLETRRGYRKFGNQIGSNPISSIFFFQRDDSQQRNLISICGWQYYTYTEGTNTWGAIPGFTIMEYETLPGRTARRARADFAVYKNTCYITDGVNPYAKRDWTTFSQIGISWGTTGATFDNTTDTITKATHGLSDGNEIFFTGSSLPTGITQYQVYYVISSATNTFKISTAKNGTAVDFTTNGSGTITYYKLTEPRGRYIQYLGDRLFLAWDDANPITLYYTKAAPTNWDNIDQNAVVIGGDETGIINWIREYSQVVVVFKDHKSYGVNVTWASAEPIDAETGGYSDRTIDIVESGMIYFWERGMEVLTKRDWVSGTSAIKSTGISEKVDKLISTVAPASYNSNAALYVKQSNNYYLTIDTNGDDIPDTTLVRSSLTGSRSEFTFPSIYDYAQYINSNGEVIQLFTSAVWGQVYQFDYGYDDDGTDIAYELQTWPRDFGRPGTMKTFGSIVVTGYKQQGGQIDVDILVDGAVQWGSTITDTALAVTSSLSLGVSSIGVNSIGWTPGSDDLPMYRYTFKIPFFFRGTDVAIRLSATGTQFIFEKSSIEVDLEENELFNFNSIG